MSGVENIQELANSFSDDTKVGITITPGEGAVYFNEAGGFNNDDVAYVNDGGFGSGPAV